MAKTALQQLRDYAEKYNRYDSSLLEKIDSLLEVERMQMIEFGERMQMISGISSDGDISFLFNPADAFTRIYNNQEESVFEDNDPLKFIK